MLSHGPATLSPHSHDSEPQLLFSTTILQCVVALSIIAALTDHTHTISHPQSPVPNDMLPNNLVTVWLRQITTTKVWNHFTWFQSSKLLLCLVLHRYPIRKLARVLFPHLCGGQQVWLEVGFGSESWHSWFCQSKTPALQMLEYIVCITYYSNVAL